MGPSPNPSQTSLDNVKFTPIPASDEEDHQQQQQLKTESNETPLEPPLPNAGAGTTTDSHLEQNGGNHRRQNSRLNQLNQKHHLTIPRYDPDEVYKITIEDADGGYAGASSQFPLTPSPETLDPLSPPEESKTWVAFLKGLFYVIVTVVVLVLISSIVAVTIASAINDEDSSSHSGVNDSYILTTESIVSNSSSSSPSSSSTLSNDISTTTFPKSECLPSEFRCPTNDRCLPGSARCDKMYDCPDMADEANCTDCDVFECASTKVCLWGGKARCDMVLDCPDFSDEIGCKFNPFRHRLCKNGVRISRQSWCDGLDDCMDNSDEEKCECDLGEVPCEENTRGQCIPRSSLCDGYQDCHNGFDEMECGACQQDEFQCSDLSCIHVNRRCDGKIDCPGDLGEDEKDCVRIQPSTHIVQVLSNNKWTPVCSDGWTREHSASMCQGQRHVESWSAQDFETSPYAVVKEMEPVGISRKVFDISPACKTGKVITLKCQEEHCGERKVPSLQNTVAGGELSPLGKWPWMASLHHDHAPICGAVIIDQSWAITALHCVAKFYPKNATSTPSLTIIFGSIDSTPINSYNNNNNNNNNKDNKQVRRVTRFYPHPQSTILHHGGFTYDLALLRLEPPIVTYSDLVQPICLPESHQTFSPNSVCYLAGWGMLSESMVMKPAKLRETRLRVWSEPQCAANVEKGETTVDTNSTLCAGYFYGLPSGCQGDSGGPLMCLQTPHHHSSSFSYRWTLAGVLSSSQSMCGQVQPNAMANRFARVATSVQWIENVIGGQREEDPDSSPSLAKVV